MKIEPLPLIYAPNKIFKQKAIAVPIIDDEIRHIVDRMLKTLAVERAVGIGANMVGILKRIAVVQADENKQPFVFINPEITWFSEETQIFEEASISFPGISAPITRPSKIKLSYLDYNGNNKELEAEGFLATVIQHEVDYLDGKVFLDYLSKLKQDTLLKKMQKFLKSHVPHVHTEHCRH
jgi:peptide deformylase